MAGKDWFPAKIEELPEWYQNFYTQLQALQAKYGITGAQVDEIKVDNNWIQYWVPAMHEIEQQVEAMDTYFDAILTEPEGTPPPSAVTIALPGGVPAEAPPGARNRARDIANYIKGNPDYVVSDGELLGIVTTGGALAPEESVIADFKLRTLALFSLEATFKKLGNDGMRFEERHKGGDWAFATVLTASPGTFAVTPATPGEAEQIEVRSILIRKNEPFGNYSDIKTAFIAP